jgi:hypothetical protein
MKSAGLLMLVAMALTGCAQNGEIGFDHHPGDCAIGFPHSDCLPGTAGYRPALAALNPTPEIVGPPLVQIPRADAIAEFATAFCSGEGWPDGAPERTSCESRQRTDLAPKALRTDQASIEAARAVIVLAHERCADSGITAPSASFAACFREAVANISAEMRQSDAAMRAQQQAASAARAQAADRQAAALMLLGASMVRASTPPAPVPALVLAPRPLSCTSFTFGATTNTNCH